MSTDDHAAEEAAAIARGEAAQAAAKRHYLLLMAVEEAQDELDQAVLEMEAHGEEADVDRYTDLGIQEGVAERRAAREAKACAAVIAAGGQLTPVGGGR